MADELIAQTVAKPTRGGIMLPRSERIADATPYQVVDVYRRPVVVQVPAQSQGFQLTNTHLLIAGLILLFLLKGK